MRNRSFAASCSLGSHVVSICWPVFHTSAAAAAEVYGVSMDSVLATADTRKEWLLAALSASERPVVTN